MAAVTRSSKTAVSVAAVAALMMIGLAPAAQAGPLDPVAVPDADLLACINGAILGHGPTDPVTEGDMAGISQLVCGQDSISDLTGLEMATSLEVLDLNQNDVTDVSPLQNLTTLTDLYVAQNDITDFTPVLGLPSLARLSLGGNTDLNAELADIGSITTLTRLSLSSSSLTNVAPLANLTSLKHLELRNNSISDLSPLASLTSLEYLNVNNNSVSDVLPLASLTSLTDLSVGINSISDVSALASLTALATLNISRNEIVDVSPLETMPITLNATDQTVDLGELVVGFPEDNPVINVAGLPVALDDLYDAGANTLTATTPGSGQVGWAEGVFSGTLDFEAVEGIVMPDAALRACVNGALGQNPADPITVADTVGLTSLTCDGLGIVDLTGLGELTDLEDIILDDNDITDVAPLAGLPNLYALSISGNAIGDLTPLGSLTALRALALENNGVSVDLSQLSSLSSLLSLYLASNDISDVSDLAGLTDLVYLVLADNDLDSADLTHLEGMSDLLGLQLDQNNITDVTSLSGLTQLEFLYLNNNAIADVSSLSGLSAYVTAMDQMINLGQLVIDEAAANPVVTINGDPVALDALYDSAANAFTPVTLGAGTVGWLASSDNFSGTLAFTVAAQDETITPDPDTDPVVDEDEGGDGSGADESVNDDDGTTEASTPGLAATGLNALGSAGAAAGLLLVGALMIARTRRKLQ